MDHRTRTAGRALPNPAIVLVVALIVATRAGAATYFVAPDGTGDFPTIQAAVDAASSGDTLELSNGTFTGAGNHSITFAGKTLTVQSRSGDPQACVIDMQGGVGQAVRAFFYNGQGPAAVLRNLTVARGYIDGC